MDMLVAFTEKLALATLFSGFCELLLPDGECRKAARFAFGAVITALLLEPIGSIL